ncbi:MAG: hypothetical protein A2Y25_11410 [Candidatus Melainabacteria bacterium GWF2_37_15]|nr:MAG: hypothetical protein A2Y25_11410 [Candidatus Melainabacteria bacterium GWF2_37_15]
MTSMQIDPILLLGILITGLGLLIYLFNESIKKPVIAYFLIQLTVIWIFFGQKILGPMGLEIKPHAVVFLLTTLVSFYFIFKHFDYLWSYKPFRYLFFFFIISTIYAIFYKTDFRSSSYIDLWIHNNLGLKHSAIKSGLGTISREFGSSETKYIVYLAGLAPLIAFVAGFMSFKSGGLKPTLQNLISFFSFTSLTYLIFLGISILAGTSTLMFIQGRLAIDGGFTGNDFEALLLIMLVGFYLYIQKNRDFKLYEPTKWSIITNIIILSLLILLGIKKGTILSLFIATHVVIGLIFAVKLYYKEKIGFNFNPAFLLAPIFLIVLPTIFCPEFAETTLYNIQDRFASTDTIDIRMVNWELYNQYWAGNFDFFKALFGFGIDSSREATFFLTAMHPEPSMQQPHIHSIYLEMFYNYGLIALLFFLPFILILFGNFKDILHNKYNIFNCLSVTIILFFLVYYITESPAVPSIIVIFSLLGFLESIRRALSEHQKENPVYN